ncbi:MAG: CBS domain-containing protein [Hyphomicrobiaceae bacterium]|nr:CBS domain-containing protein [Hyphomicrobiaceae bacterium]
MSTTSDTSTTTLRELLDEKGRDVWDIHPDDSVFNAVTKMSIKDCGGLLVMEDDKIVGIITERDYTRNVILKGKTSPETPVRDIMTADVICVEPDKTVTECLEIMTEQHVRHLPVLEGGKVAGMVSIGDLVKRIIADQKAALQVLQGSGTK